MKTVSYRESYGAQTTLKLITHGVYPRPNTSSSTEFSKITEEKKPKSKYPTFQLDLSHPPLSYESVS